MINSTEDHTLIQCVCCSGEIWPLSDGCRVTRLSTSAQPIGTEHFVILAPDETFFRDTITIWSKAIGSDGIATLRCLASFHGSFEGEGMVTAKQAQNDNGKE